MLMLSAGDVRTNINGYNLLKIKRFQKNEEHRAGSGLGREAGSSRPDLGDLDLAWVS